MKREIKFRGWDNERNVYLNPIDIIGLCGETTKELKGMTPYLELEQFTGLTDKNGKEIYEGDIIAVMRGDVLVFNAKEVFYYKGCPCLDIEYDGEISPLYWYEEDEKFEFQVIGNIH